MTYRADLKAAREHILNARDHFRLLGVHRESSKEDISAARKRLAQVVHTDKMVANGVRVEEDLVALVNVAADTLLDEKRRKLYLAELAKGRKTCPTCKGKGNVRKQLSIKNIVFNVCPVCQGCGLILE
jgi:DnaJ-class molecular chaperone